MSSPALPQLPREIILLILSHLVADCMAWDILRTRLHLRLVSTWFGSAFERGAFREISLDIDSPKSSGSHHLLKLLQTNPRLARHIQYLSVDDHRVYSTYLDETSETETGSWVRRARIAQYKEAVTEQRDQLASLMRLRLELKEIYIDFLCPFTPTPALSLFPEDMKPIHYIMLHGAAVFKHLQDVITIIGHDTTLLLDVSSFDLAPSENEEVDVTELGLNWTSPPLPLQALIIYDDALAFSVPFLARIPMEPHCLVIKFTCYTRLGELVDTLIEGSSLATMEGIYFEPSQSASEADQAAAMLEISRQIKRLEAAGSADLQVSVQDEQSYAGLL